jgi:hypothetical protein
VIATNSDAAVVGAILLLSSADHPLSTLTLPDFDRALLLDVVVC